ncbi:MAG: AMP-binding protein, partial [Burkholderiaceae bacterium]
MHNSVETSSDQYQQLYEQFRWQVPEDFNLAEVCCSRWASDPQRVAIYYDDENGGDQILTYAQLQRDANRLSHVL